MPGKVKVKVIAGRNLPVMDRSSDTTDAYVEVKLGNTTYKTDVCRKSLNPQWNSEWYRFEVDDSELQDEPLQIQLMDHDTYTSNDFIGKVYIDLNPLLLPAVCKTEASGSVCRSDRLSPVLSGWIPVYDTMHGIRGEVNIVVKLELFSDFNKFRQSSCGVQFFCSTVIPHGYTAQIIHGFVEELVVSDDPEYQWIDKIRTPRASNEARQTLFFKISGEIQRKIGLKALDLGGNSVIGYSQNFDLEGESGIVARGIGTAVTLIRTPDIHNPLETSSKEVLGEDEVEGSDGAEVNSKSAPQPPPVASSGLPRSAAQPIHRRSSDSDLSITPRAGSLTGSDRSSGQKAGMPPPPRPTITQENVDMLEYPFLTMSKYPPGFIQHLGGTVSARSVKLLERITNLEEPQTRDAWWSEIRMEVRSHARALGCNVVIGYSESTSICDDVCVLSAAGTAALINVSYSQDDVFTEQGAKEVELESPCVLCHVPYAENSVPFRVSMHRCAVCRRAKVPDVLFTTIELVDVVPSLGKGCFIHAYVARPKRDCKGEINAKEISDGLPFLEYDLHRLLMSKLKVKGMNAIQSLKVQISIGDKMLIGLATGTAALLTALPPPPLPKLSAGNSWKDRKKLADMQKILVDSFNKNMDFYNLHPLPDIDENSTKLEELELNEDDLPELDLGLDNKDACILEVDDAEDADIVSLLTDPRPTSGFHIVSTEGVAGLKDTHISRNLQMFTHVWRARIPYGQPLSSYNMQINRLLQSLVFKLRNTRPASLNGLQLKVLLEQDEVQLSATGMAVGLSEKKLENGSGSDNIPSKPRKHMPPKSRYGVDITPLSFVPGATIEKYLGNLNFFFIRESTCVREGGGLSGFMHNFVTEVLAMVRAHVTALGGNAMVAYFMSECFLYNFPHKNQGQCLINVGGDAVLVSDFPTDVNSGSS